MRDPKYQRIKLVKIMEILYRKSDEEHPITTNQMIYELGQLGISVERRTMYTDIQALKDYGYDIHSKRTQHDSVYWVSKHSFDLPELKIIMDCIHSSKFVTESKTKELIDKIADLGGSARGELLKRNAIHFDAVKYTNEAIYKIVDVLERAIEKCKKVTFNYYLLDQNGQRVYKHDKKLYLEEPIAMVCNDGNYYLLCYRPEEEYENHIKTFRIDRIDNISMLDEDISKEGRTSLRKARQYSLQAFKMYGGPLRRITLIFNESLINVIYNKFGEQTVIKKYKNKYTASVQVQISPTFWGWMLQFPTQMKIKSPEDLKEQYREWVLSAIEKELNNVNGVRMMEICNILYIAKSGEDSSNWLPLRVHHMDTCMVMRYLLGEFVSDSFACSCGMKKNDLEKTAVFLALVHDIGKASPSFQYKIGFCVPERADKLKRFIDIPERMDMKSIQKTPHAYVGEAILNYIGCPESIAAVIGAHHGVPAESYEIEDLTRDKRDICNYRNYFGDTESTRLILENSWKEIFEQALAEAGFAGADDLPTINIQAQMLLCGLLITSDWIASNTEFFPLISIDKDGDEIDQEVRVFKALNKLAFPESWKATKTTYSDSEFESTFGFLQRTVQKRMIEIAEGSSHPGLFILEAPMGCGKTEAALATAELTASKCKKNGLFFGMPTQATANGIFPRVISWAEKQSEEFYHTVQLKHGSSAFNETFQKIQRGIPDEVIESGIIVHSWFCDSKKACLSDFVTATVDQMLMMALKRRHVMLLHLGLSEKVVIIDEVHAYDAYMNQYLERALRWLGAYRTPVILLSATLPSKRRMSLIRAYLGKKKSDECFEKNMAYPLLTWTDNGEIKQESLPYSGQQKAARIRRCRDEDVSHIVRDAVNTGGCVGIIMNTVRRAQSVAELIRSEITDNVLLYHSQYIMPDRGEKEKKILKRTGRESTTDVRKGLVVVGTQVLEQSLDIDFDLLITDICPVDLLLQRIGRLHRHDHDRPDALRLPECCVITDEYENDNSGSQSIYGTWLLKETINNIPEIVTLPDDISPLVQKVYDSFDESDEYKNYKNKNDISVGKAGCFLMKKPTCKDIHGLLDRSVNDSQAEASVRDGDESIEVLVMKLYSDGTMGFIDNTKLSGELTENECLRIAEQRLRLPSRFSSKWSIDKTIAELEKKCRPYITAWQKNYLLKGQLVLFLDDNNEAELAGCKLKYDFQNGLMYKRSDELERH